MNVIDNRIHTERRGERARPYSYQELLLPAWRNRKRILLLSFTAAALTLAVNFLLIPPSFQVTTTLLPETEKGSLSALGNMAEIAQLASVDIGTRDVARLYPSIATSETVLRGAVEKSYNTTEFPSPVNLMDYWGTDGSLPEERMDAALRKLRGMLTADYDTKAGIVTLTLEMPEPGLAADVLNEIVAGLDEFMRHKKTSSASEQLKWIDGRLREVGDELHTAEENLTAFREKNRRVIDSPQLLLEQGRLTREMELKSAIYVELKKQSEIARIEEVKSTTIVNVLDPARPPVRKSHPKRATNTLLMFLLVLAGTSAFYAVRSLYGERIRAFLSPFRPQPKSPSDGGSRS